jgi:RyR domain
MLNISDVARICHEANHAYCESIADYSQNGWNEAAEWQRQSAIKGVEWRLANPEAPESAQHEAWVEEKVREGWVYGPVKDAEKKFHPCLVPYDELPAEQRAKDALFAAIVTALKPMMHL